MSTYYVVKNNSNTSTVTFDLRQTRYAEMFEAGKEHENDLMAKGFTKGEMISIINQYFNDTDDSALSE